MTDEAVKVLKLILAEEKKQTSIFGKMAVAIKDWQGQDKHYHNKTLKKLEG
jgi:hypothetical protein